MLDAQGALGRWVGSDGWMLFKVAHDVGLGALSAEKRRPIVFN
jgi:hypothetical protein